MTHFGRVGKWDPLKQLYVIPDDSRVVRGLGAGLSRREGCLFKFFVSWLRQTAADNEKQISDGEEGRGGR